jgi:hypothetical protein
MRKAIFAYLDAGGEGFDPPVLEALLKLKAEAAGTAAGVPETSFQGT